VLSASKTYADNGSYTVRLTAIDEDGSYQQTLPLAIANVAPTLTMLGSIILVLYKVFAEGEAPTLVLLLMPLYLTLTVLILMQVVITIALPVKWPAIRDEFAERMRLKLSEEFGRAFLPIPGEIATAVNNEGIEDQVAFLLENHWTGVDILFKVKEKREEPV
jgi:hypothetical protein